MNDSILDEIKGNKAVLKALEIIDYIGEIKEPVHLKQIAQALNLPESTVHRLLASLSVKTFCSAIYLRQSLQFGMEVYNTRQLAWNLWSASAIIKSPIKKPFQYCKTIHKPFDFSREKCRLS